MMLATNIVVGIVAALHVYFLVLEMFLWTKPLGLKTFRQSQQKADDSAVLAANQGLQRLPGRRTDLGTGSSGCRHWLPDQSVLFAVRDRGRTLWRILGEREDYPDPGGSRGAGACLAVVRLARGCERSIPLSEAPPAS